MKIRKFTCDNGLPVFLVPMKNTHMMTGVFAVRGGWGYESKDIKGTAHFLEHLMFRGTPRRPSTRAIASGIENVGGWLHALTTEEIIAYFIHIPSEHSFLLCDVLADLILNSCFDPIGTRIELESIIEELRKNESDPWTKLQDAFSKLLFDGHPAAGWPGIGTEASVRAIEREMVVDYYRSCFVSSNSALCIAGRIEEPNELFSEINRLFGALSSSLPLRERVRFADTQSRPELVVVEYNIPQTKIELGVKCPGITLDDKYPMKVLGSVLGGGWTSRLYHELLEDRGLLYEFNIDFTFKGDTSHFAFCGGVKQERWLEAVKIVLNEFAALRENGVSLGELERAKHKILERERRSWEGSENVVHYLIDQWADYDEVSFKDETDGIRAVTAKDVMRVAQKFFRDEHLNLAVLGPHSKETRKIKRALHF